MNPQWFEFRLLLGFYETLAWTLVWLMVAIFAAELVCILVMALKAGRPNKQLKSEPLSVAADDGRR